ncbi:hypothetical protein KEF85_06150 [Methylomonas paludis]|uniref:Uncharacterized protein n=1 Tax=Methylomonas paludis TaxID=1173101 RepID=A0A975RB61_9GAMM|nr:hypothetical protein [Methylomonas paludis]QWF72034.1 hypothetical protein KEF85_06150 [Methylomonas paludis]
MTTFGFAKNQRKQRGLDATQWNRGIRSAAFIKAGKPGFNNVLYRLKPNSINFSPF